MVKSSNYKFKVSVLHVFLILLVGSNLCISSKSEPFSPDSIEDASVVDLSDHGGFENVDVNAFLRKNHHDRSSKAGNSGETSLKWPGHKNCDTFTNCTACYHSSYACHWCSNDDKCHVRGSWHGCSVGATCSSDDPVDNSCHAHKSCEACTLSSTLCHWCAFDNQCHAMGSIHGCVSGVNCYSNDRCERSKPEQIKEGYFDHIGVIPLVLIFSVSFMSLCCVSMLFAGAGILHALNFDGHRIGNVPPMDAFSHQEFSQDELQLIPMQEETVNGLDSDGVNDEIQDHDGANSSEGENIDNKRNVNNVPGTDAENQNFGEEQERTSTPVEENQISHDMSPPTLNDDSHSQLTESLLPRPVTAHPHPSRLPPTRNFLFPSSGDCYIKCLMRSCKLWFIFSIVSIVGFTTASIAYFPKAPEYNVCSDEFAWSSIIKGLTSLKMEASFEILISVKNKNRFDMALEGFGGKFKHDGEDIGTFSFPRTIVEGTSITDLLITCTVVPGRWKALGLIADYWKGDLSVIVDANGSVKVHGIGLSFPVKVSDALVKVTDPDMDDRHLCACPEWKDLVPTASPGLSFEEAVMDPATIHRNLPIALSNDAVELLID
mmetsp:Transcript_8229/g.12641  ORF Transcript_8229/g.12641 Transcript_8229/m.12641 type:complete len:603 (+) Transcript_8229:83-1891(+)|eukprot:CAMPEP_0178913474 /NCGR_PEP_ID=MMETSP0786-20121207/10862_1 /TAXON_ID=186022 /ORGANISM="Thalassionema frauenfeldii, Strain CCMP 1798" /LENGTH=602 /DNA_ID=CAMNT_0020586219 /DNA_START=68 /DNA_END=1876 /DNA_ORIENTATION=+